MLSWVIWGFFKHTQTRSTLRCFNFHSIHHKVIFYHVNELQNCRVYLQLYHSLLLNINWQIMNTSDTSFRTNTAQIQKWWWIFYVSRQGFLIRQNQNMSEVISNVGVRTNLSIRHVNTHVKLLCIKFCIIRTLITYQSVSLRP